MTNQTAQIAEALAIDVDQIDVERKSFSSTYGEFEVFFGGEWVEFYILSSGEVECGDWFHSSLQSFLEWLNPTDDDGADEEEEGEGEHLYGLLARPYFPGSTQPAGEEVVENYRVDRKEHSGRRVHAVLKYDRKLSANEIQFYSLHVIDAV